MGWWEGDQDKRGEQASCVEGMAQSRSHVAPRVRSSITVLLAAAHVLGPESEPVNCEVQVQGSVSLDPSLAMTGTWFKCFFKK